jgi:hypothetical protein
MLKTNTLNILPAYRGPYATRTEAAKDWAQGKDFKIVCGPYCSVRDVGELSRRYTHLAINIANGQPLIVELK